MNAPAKRHAVLQSGRAMPELEAVLAERYDVTILSNQPDPARFLAEHGKKFEAMVSTSKNGVDAALMDALPNVKAIAHFGEQARPTRASEIVIDSLVHARGPETIAISRLSGTVIGPYRKK